MSYQFKIPRQRDQSLVEALTQIRNEMQGLAPLFVRVSPHFNGPPIDLKDQDPVSSGAVAYVLGEHSEVMPNLYLVDQNTGHTALSVQRQPNEITDVVTVHWEHWMNAIPEQERKSKVFVKLNALARKRLRPFDAEASLLGVGDTAWSRYRDAQQAILSSLQETQKSIAVEFTRHSLEAEATAKAKYETLAAELMSSHETMSSKLA